MDSTLREETAFPNYTQIPSVIPAKIWHLLRAVSVLTAFSFIYLFITSPDKGLFIFWKVVLPLLPLVFLLMPGLWRNICPLAALNQLPRLIGITKGMNHTRKIKEYSYVIGISLFFILASSRKVLFNESGTASAMLIGSALFFAFLGGFIFKGKSGWCSSICPLLPVQRLYGQTPFVTVPNSHCKPCVGCTKNCYDFNPSVAYLADQYDSDKYFSGYRRFFAAAFPGFIFAYYTVPDPPVITASSMYVQIFTYMIISIGIFFLLDTFAKVSVNKLTALCAASALNIYYWFSFPVLLSSFGVLAGTNMPEELLWLLRSALIALTFFWISRTFRTEKVFIAQQISSTLIQNVKLGKGAIESFGCISGQKNAEVTYLPDNKRVSCETGRSILELTESCGLSIESGCRMGVCGADPVAIKDGMDNLTPIGSDEKATLERLGYAENTRMACCARINGNVSLSLQPEKKSSAVISVNTDFDREIKSIVIIGNGIAGVTAADHIRRRHPECEIHLIGREKNHLYNRMGISRLIYGRSAMQGLYLLPDSWYDEHNITCWLNTHAVKLDTENRKVRLATGEELEFDRLIIATGSRSFIPKIEGFGVNGTFSLREAEDAMNIRNYVQLNNSQYAVIAGGGLLGLEAAYAVHKLGLRVTVLERGQWPLQRQLDQKGGNILKNYLDGLGLEILTESEISLLNKGSNNIVTEAVLKDGRIIKCDLFLICAGVQPNKELAAEAGIQSGKGIIVDGEMRTNTNNIFAVGDAAECNSQLFGLWPVAVEQAEIAAVNATGGKSFYKGYVPTTMLKVVGAEVTSVGRFDPLNEGDSEIIPEEKGENKYRKLVINNGRIAGAILIGYPLEAPIVTKAVKEGTDVSPVIDSLKNGNWSELKKIISE